MKKTSIITSVLAIALLSGCSKWAGDPITQTFTTSGNYTELEVEDAFDVVVSNSVDQVTITAGDNVMPNVRVEERDNTLKIYIKGWLSNRSGDKKVILPYNESLRKVDLSGASDFQSTQALKSTKVEVELSGASSFDGIIDANEVEMDLSGSSSLKGQVTAASFEIDMSGASDATIDGTVGTLELSISGSSRIAKKVVGNQYSLACDRCIGSLSGSSDVFLHCDGTIQVSISGSSDLHYTGNANTTGSSTSGSSNIVHDAL